MKINHHPHRLAAHPHHPVPHVSATLQRSSRLRNAEKKNTWSNIQVCDNLEIMQELNLAADKRRWARMGLNTKGSLFLLFKQNPCISV